MISVPAGVRHVTRSRGPLLAVVADADRHRATTLAAGARPRAVASIPPTASSTIVADLHANRRPDALALVEEWLPSGAAPDRRRADIARVVATLDVTAAHAGVGAALADRFGVSPSHLSTLFHRHVGVTLRAWLSWKRTVAALAALRPGKLSETAVSVGFADHAHLTRTVTAHTGYTPARLSRARCA